MLLVKAVPELVGRQVATFTLAPVYMSPIILFVKHDHCGGELVSHYCLWMAAVLCSQLTAWHLQRKDSDAASHLPRVNQ